MLSGILSITRRAPPAHFAQVRDMSASPPRSIWIRVPPRDGYFWPLTRLSRRTIDWPRSRQTFAGAMDFRMARRDLLDQRGSGSWHPDDEDR